MYQARLTEDLGVEDLGAEIQGLREPVRKCEAYRLSILIHEETSGGPDTGSMMDNKREGEETTINCSL